jgi:DNA-binding transcriptional LysR family regulator
LEARLGVTLFHRRPDGLHATPEAIELLPAAEAVEQSMLTLGRVAQGATAQLRGSVRVSLTPILGAGLLMAEFVEFCRLWPQIELHIEAGWDLANLDSRAADVAIRLVPHGTSPAKHLTGRLAASVWVADYGDGDCWIGQRGGAWDRRWIEASAFPELPVRGTINDGEVLRAACAAGLGMVSMPCFYAEPMLTRRSEPRPGFDAWVLVHPDLKRHPRLRVFRDFVVEAFNKHRDRLEGRTALGASQGT